MKKHKFYSWFFIFTLSSTGFAQNTLNPVKANVPPIIDAHLDDAVWQQGLAVKQFKTVSPDFGLTPAEHTEAFLAYDRENLYFALRCYDKSPGQIKASLTNRDNIQGDDWICINLDTFGDQQSLYALYVNPLGVQGDSRYAAGNEDHSIDLVWDSAGRIDENGYTIEIRLPLKSIRFATSDIVSMGVVFERRISRKAEQSMYPPMDPAQGYNIIAQMAPFQLIDLKHPRLFEVLPAATYAHRDSRQDGKMAKEARDGDLSMTLKYGITSELILDGTLNPDFSQIEADAGQVDVNLRYALFFPEKRPFFLEGRENFRMASTVMSERDPVRALFYTRTITNPQVGIKLNGKIGAKNTLACLYATDDLGQNQLAHVPTLRYRRTLKNDGFVGVLGTMRETEQNGNRIGGLDGQLRLTPSSLLRFHALQSQKESKDDNSNKDGTLLGLSYQYGTRNWDAAFSYRDISKDFQADMGYIRRRGLRQITGLIRPKIYPGSHGIRRIDVECFTAQSRDLFDAMWETFNHTSLQFFFNGDMTLKLKYSYSTEIFLGRKFDTGGFHVFGWGQINNQVGFGVLYRRTGAIRYTNTPFQGRSNQITLDGSYQPSDRFWLQGTWVSADFTDDATGNEIYKTWIARGNLTYQFNRFLFFRTILEYSARSVYDAHFHQNTLLADFLISFTYIPGTVVHLGYGSLHRQMGIQETSPLRYDAMMTQQRGFFFKTSYLWRL